LSRFRTPSPSKTDKIKIAVTGLVLAAAAVGSLSVWSASAAAEQATSGRETHLSSAIPAGQAARSEALAGRWQSAASLQRGQQAVLDAVSATAASAKKKHHKAHARLKGSRSGEVVQLTPKQIARRMLRSFHWSKWQFRWLNLLWTQESNWNVYASNPYSGAYGIPQAVPGDKMASAGPDWQSDARTQIRWGLQYIKQRYGSPYAAWQHELATGWY